MSENKNATRRDFLKFGSLAAVSLPVINEVGNLGEYTLLESEEEYGGFLVRVHDTDDPPYQVDESVYQRFDANNTVFGRMFSDPDLQAKLQSAVPLGQAGDPGWTRLDDAFGAGAGLLAAYNGSNAGWPGKHSGLFQLEPINESMSMHGDFDGVWDHSHLTDADVATIVKKAAKFYGASLVGIAPLDERWIYSAYSDMGGDSGKIVFTEVEEVELPEGQVTPAEAKGLVQAELAAMEADDLKDFIVTAMESADPSALPADAPGTGMISAMPAGTFKEMLPMMFESMPTVMIGIFAEMLGLDFEIAQIDPSESARARYLEDGTLAIPETMKWVIVMAFEMDYDTIEAYPSPLGAAAAYNGYSRMSFTAPSVAEFIRRLGYNAIPCGNMTGLSVPMAIDAGLGELGRQGILITPKYGPRVRLAKVITDLPMVTDKPISFGVKEFCDVCGKCAESCPSQAISYEAQSDQPRTLSNNAGVMKWPLDPERCMVGWQMSGGDCGNCIRVCPFNKVDTWLHEATRVLIGAKSGNIDKLMVQMDTLAGFGGESAIEGYWEKDNFIHIKD